MTKMKSRSLGSYISLILVILILISSCKPEITFNDNNLIKGNASPILLSLGETQINLEDYVLDVTKIDSVSLPEGLVGNREANMLTLAGNLQSWLSDIHVWSQGQAYSIPVQKTSKSKVIITYTGNAKSVKVKGEFNAWNPTELTKTEKEYSIELILSPGNYQYVFVLDGKEKRDLSNPDSISNGMGNYNSIIKIPRADKTKLPLISTDKINGNEIVLKLLNSATEVKVYWKNFLLNESVTISENTIKIKIPEQAQNEKRSFIRIWAANSEGISNDGLVPLDFGKVLDNPNQLVRQDKESQVLYFLMVDRFNNGSKENDEPVADPSIHPKANYYGGDIVGITQKLKNGYFTKLGINTLWLSPITQNPKGAFGKYPNPPTTFSGYHGYWPVSLQQIDYRFGTKQELEELIQLAHDQNINVILDYVAHHVHQEHPLYKLKPEWFTSLYLPDGTLNTERWDDHRLTTWFDVFMPTLDLSRPEVVGPMTDTAMYWVEQYDLDGFRHDASKHIDLLFWRELTKKVKSKVERPVYQIGETYGSRELVNSYVNTGMLDAQFDFNVYDDAVGTFASNDASFTRLANSITESIEWFGDHNLMGYISGNQDRARFISYADGSIRFDEDAKKAGWTREIKIQDTIGYKKLQSLHAFNMTIPGVPVIYYADEIGDAGGNDPDNRRMMRFEALNKFENQTLETTTKLVNIRRNNLALIYGDFQLISVTDTQFVYKRKYFSNEVVVVFNKGSEAATINLGKLAGNVKANFNSETQLQNQETILTLLPYSFEIITIDLN
jgi:cyclomaltodextrinase / maltogenic alpha-amylase / neopullulanase